MNRTLAIASLLAIAACAGPERDARQVYDPERPWRQPGDVIDSILPMEEYLRRFRVGTREVTALSGGGQDEKALVDEFLAATAAQDTMRLLAMKVTRGEFAWLVFPHHLYMEPPYELDPAILWSQMESESEKGLGRLLREYGGRVLSLRSVACEADTLVLTGGPGQLRSNCVVDFTADGTAESRRLFGSIYLRGGAAKFMGFSNEF